MKDETKGRHAACSGKKKEAKTRMGEGKTERGSNVEERVRNNVVCTQRAMLQRWREPLCKGKYSS